MFNQVKQEADTRMTKSVQALQDELTKIRTGRAHPSLLDDLRVNYYGQATPLNQVASVAVSDSRTLSINPWEKTMVSPIEKAILDSGLGLNPVTLGHSIKVPMPPLTEERRRSLTKVVRQEAEQAKIAVRNARRDANGLMKDCVKDKSMTEDEERSGQEGIQKLTNEYIKKVDELLQAKEKELMEI